MNKKQANPSSQTTHVFAKKMHKKAVKVPQTAETLERRMRQLRWEFQEGRAEIRRLHQRLDRLPAPTPRCAAFSRVVVPILE